MDWDIVPVSDQNGIIVTYTVTYKLLPDETPQTVLVTALTSQVNLTDLKKYRNYSIRVFASTAKGNGNASQPIIVITDEDGRLSFTWLHYQNLISVKQRNRN